MAPRKRKVDTSLLSAEEIEKARLEAKKFHEESLRNKQLREFIEAEKEELARASDPDEELIPIHIVLPPFADRIVLDGTIYLHGWVGELPLRTYLTVQDNMARAWDHQQTTEGHAKEYRRPRGLVMGGRDAGSPAQALLRRI